MVKFYSHKTKTNILLIQYIDALSVSDAEQIDTFLSSYFVSGLTLIYDVIDQSYVTEYGFLTAMASLEKKHETHIKCISVCGLKGLQKSFYSLYLRFESTRFERLRFDLVEDLEAHYLFQIPDDFFLL